MEVHHHPNVEKKKFREYFLEFLMIFLAVTMGFFAENIREYFAEKKTVKEYLENFQDELKQNEASIHYCDSIFTLILPAEDSIVNIFFEKKENEDLKKISGLNNRSRRVINVPFQTSAYTQIVNSGGLKYIPSKTLKDSMAKYQGLIQIYINYNTLLFQQRTAYLPIIQSIEDMHDFNVATTTGTIPQIMPFPELTERERRLIISFYRHYYLQYKNDQNALEQIMNTGKNLQQMIEKELE